MQKENSQYIEFNSDQGQVLNRDLVDKEILEPSSIPQNNFIDQVVGKRITNSTLQFAHENKFDDKITKKTNQIDQLKKNKLNRFEDSTSGSSVNPQLQNQKNLLNEIKESNCQNNAFDEVPIGKTHFNISQFPSGEEPIDIDTNVPFTKKLKSKIVKLRLSGLEDLLVLISQNSKSQQLEEVEIAKLLKQSNPACLDIILQCFKKWIETGNQWGEQETRNIIENGYINGKNNHKKLTVQICDLMYQKKADCVETAIVNGLKGKVPKLLAGYIGILTQMLGIYGAKRMKYVKPYLSDVVRVITNEKLGAIKLQGLNLLKQIYKWMGKEVVEPLLANLKQGIKKQLDIFWQSYDKNVVMTAPKDIVEIEGNSGKSKRMDAYDLSDGIDLFKKFNEKWAEGVLKAEKWNDKVRMMQQFINAGSIPKITNSDHRHIDEMIRRLINDSNFNVVLMNLKILSVMSKGLRRQFSPVVKSLFSSVLAKFRDKKTQMIEQTFMTLNNFAYCISIEDVLDDIKEGLTDKAPNMKVNVINWIARFVERKIQDKGQLTDKALDAVKSLMIIFDKLLSDGTAEVRQCSAKNITKIKSLIFLEEDIFPSQSSRAIKSTNKINEIKQNVKMKGTSKEKDLKTEKQILNICTAKQNQGKVSKTHDDRQQNRRLIQNGGKVDISNDIHRLLPKMNDNNNWQNRKQAADSIIQLINQYNHQVSIHSLGDLMDTLKIRINDPNKQLIKTFVQLSGLIFQIMRQKDVKTHAKPFINALCDGLCDKVDANRREISQTLDKIGNIMGKEVFLQILGQFLDGQRDSRLQVLHIIMANQNHLSGTDTRDYTKGIVNCLCDKNKEIRCFAQKLLEKVIDKNGINNFRSIASQKRPAFTKDLNLIFDKFQKSSLLSSHSTKGLSPVRNDKKISINPNQVPRNNKSLSKINKSFDRDHELDQSQRVKIALIEQNQYFAPVKFLANERIDRQEIQQNKPWTANDLKQDQEELLRAQMQRLICKDLVSKMLSLQYRKVHESTRQIIKICKDIDQQGQIRQIYDILIKWVFLRLWGGNQTTQTVIQILPPVMSILEKKKLVLNDNDVQLIIGVIRQYFLTGALDKQSKITQPLIIIIKCLIALSSGERVLKKIFRQFTIDINNIHKHIRKQASNCCKRGFTNLIKAQMIEYVGNEDSLEEASKIKQLKNDAQFVQMLFKRFHENILTQFGFNKNIRSAEQREKSVEKSSKPDIPKCSTSNPRINTSNNFQSNQNMKVNDQNYQLKVQKRDRSRDRSCSKKSSINKTIKKNQVDFDLTIYQPPNPCSPLGKNLAKLLPPNEVTNNFFAALLGENGEKASISNQLITHAKIIFGSILKSVIQMLSKRNQYQPNKIISQVILLQQAIKCKNILNNIGDLLYHAINFALVQLVEEDQNKILIAQNLAKRGIQFEIQNFIKVINGVMLRILENGCPQDVINTLLTALVNQIELEYPSHKAICLIIKCITRVGNFCKNSKPEHIVRYFAKINDYLHKANITVSLEQFKPLSVQKIKPEETLINLIINTVSEIHKTHKSQTWTYFEKGLLEAKYPDSYIGQYLVYLQKINPSEKYKQNPNDELKKICQLLSKSKTFKSGLERLEKYIELNPSFCAIEYFSGLNYDQKFIIMVMNSLQNNINNPSPLYKNTIKSQINYQKKQQNSYENQMQDKIKALRDKFQESHSPLLKNTELQKLQDKEEIKKRIYQIKSKNKTTQYGYSKPY